MNYENNVNDIVSTLDTLAREDKIEDVILALKVSTRHDILTFVLYDADEHDMHRLQAWYPTKIKSLADLTNLIKEEIQEGNHTSDTIQNLARMLSDNLSEYDRETIATILSSGN